jgi:hypothetical protein
VSAAVDDALGWGLRSELPQVPGFLLADEAPDLTAWQDDRVGWGLILPDDATLSAADRAQAVDAPEPIRGLLADRPGAPVFRYVQDSPDRFGALVRCLANGRVVRPDIAGSAFGVAEDRIPCYLLICASPADIPWEVQYTLNARFAVGRLDLDEAGLANYVAALRSDWHDSGSNQTTAVVWATDHGATDMSHTMRMSVAKPLWEQISGDRDVGPTSKLIDTDTGGATVPRLLDALTAASPGLVVTTSHGAEPPSDGSATATAGLGLLVGDDHARVEPADVLARWNPDGAIWYAHACWSAGGSADTIYDDLFGAGSDIGLMLHRVAALGSVSSPTPRALLGANKPLRAFVGHVEPTFNWTIDHPETRQHLTGGIIAALWDGLYRKGSCPVGHAFRSLYEPIGALAAQHLALKRDFARGKEVSDQLLMAQLAARDRMSTVILGDPTVRLRFA